jgi:hypothetical protein
MRNALFLMIGLSIGMLAAQQSKLHAGWLLQHPGMVLAGAGALVCATWLVVERHMRRAAADSDRREEAFRLAMLAQFAPEQLEREIA